MDFGKFVHNLLFKKKFAKIDKPRDFINLQDAKSIGIIFNATHSKNIESVKKLAKNLSASGKKVELLGFVNDKKPEAILEKYKDDTFIVKKDVNWYYKPKTFATSRFIKNKYDILLNIYIEECLPLQYMSAFSDAKFRVGHYQANNLYCNDFHLDLKGEGTIDSLIKQIIIYLNKK